MSVRESKSEIKLSGSSAERRKQRRFLHKWGIRVDNSSARPSELRNPDTGQKRGTGLALAGFAIGLLTWGYDAIYPHRSAYLGLAGFYIAIFLVSVSLWFFFDLHWKGKSLTLVPAVIACAVLWFYFPLPEVVMTFKTSPLFTPFVKRRITRELDDYRRYLIGIGYNIPIEVPPIGVANGIGLSGATWHGGAYNAEITVPEESLHDSGDEAIGLYSIYLFRELIPTSETNVQDFKFHPQAVRIIADYFRCSYQNQFSYYQPFPPDLAKWEDWLWELRSRLGKETLDKGIFFAINSRWPLYGWSKVTPDGDFDTYFAMRIEMGLVEFDNNGSIVNQLRAFWKSKGLKFP